MSSPSKGRGPRDRSASDIGALLRAVERATPADAPDVVREHLRGTIGAETACLWIADLSGRQLVRLPGPDEDEDAGPSDSTTDIAGTPQGDVLTEQEAKADGRSVYVPVTSFGEAIGVLEVRLPEAPPREVIDELVPVGHALAYVVAANRRFTDLFEWGQRSSQLSLAAEVQRRLLPGASTLDAGRLTVAGWLQPAAQVAGDTFDYALDRDALHLSITDAMGHGLQSALLATAFVGALRNGRRRGLDLRAQADQAGSALCELQEPDGFVTGQVVRVDLRGGRAQIVNAGHPPPLRLRDGEVAQVPLRTDPPFGAVEGHRYSVQTLELRPGDRLSFLTDGMLERSAREVDLPAVLHRTAGLHPRDAVQELMHAVLDATEDDLPDDACAMCVDWSG